MSEMEELKKNTERQKAMQTRDELKEYLVSLENDIEEADYWVNRGHKLDMFVLVSHFAIVVLSAIPDQFFWADMSLIVLFLSLLRSSVLTSTYIGCVRELIGALKALEILEVIERKNGTKRRKTAKIKSRFSRYKEFWERMTGKSAQEKHA